MPIQCAYLNFLEFEVSTQVYSQIFFMNFPRNSFNHFVYAIFFFYLKHNEPLLINLIFLQQSSTRLTFYRLP